MAPKRMTANPLKPARHRAGKPTAESSSSEGSDSEPGEAKKKLARKIAPAPKFKSAGTVISRGEGAKVDFGAEEKARREAATRARIAAERRAREQGFVSDDGSDGIKQEDESGSESGSGDGSEEESSEEESSSEEEAPRRLLLKPKFMSKKEREAQAQGTPKAEDLAAEAAAEEIKAEERKKAMDEMLEEEIKKNIAAKQAGKKHWDDSEDSEDDVDDTDDIDPEAEYAAWKLRELKRIRREREAIEAKEKELAEIERRRNLTEEERRAEDEEHLAKQKEEKEGRGKMAYMQKYFHKGAFYQDESKTEGLDKRDIMGTRFADDVRNRELLPKALQLRDMTKLGRKGATKYRDLKSEDTGSWGGFSDGRQRRDFDRNLDERFQPDRDRDWDRRDGGGDGGKGANAIPLGDRKPPPGAPDGPRRDRDRGEGYRSRDGGERDRRRSGSPRRDARDRRRSRSRSPRRDRDDYRDRKRERSRDRYSSEKRSKVDSR
ncbi:hypothetical protein GQ53DRAFT_742560 [Thozetella sp. PMI_491]|nr:hypothetical protein GQ53DRAFT_742560 [Thozetella sp. PMI_491]